MTREDKILLAIEKGYTCDPTTGKVYGVRGNEIKAKRKDGYIVIGFRDSKVSLYLLSQHFVYYWVNTEIVEYIDHINGVRDDNRIENLRSVTNQQNSFNTKAKGYTWCKRDKKWQSQIYLTGKNIYLGSFNTEKEARQVYLDAKKIHHII